MTTIDPLEQAGAERLAWGRRALVRVLAHRPTWATAYVRRQLRLADEELHCSEQLLEHTERAADSVERTPTARLAELHRAMRRELYASVRDAERRLARSGAYALRVRGVILDDATAGAVAYVAREVRPALAEIAEQLA